MPRRCVILTFGLSMLASLVSPPVVPGFAQAPPDAAGAADLPLDPPDLSSPRDTLRTYLVNADALIDSLLNGRLDQIALARAAGALDFTTTPHGDSWPTRVQRLVMLKSILDRLELPPDAEIPGDAAVASGEVVEWVIPETAITITAAADGPRAGRFVFSAETVQQLDQFYRQVRDLAPRPPATGDVYGRLFADATASALGTGAAASRLRPPDTSSPLATLEQFLESVNRAYAIVLAAGRDRGLADTDLRASEAAAREWLDRAVATLDLSGVPQVMREDVGVEVALRLKEVLDRLALPPFDAVPDAEAVAAARRGEGLLRWQSAEPLRWRYPDTTIELVEIGTRERRGEFLFSAGTVRSIGELHRAVADLPYRVTQAGPIEEAYASPATSPGFLERYMSSTETLVPRASVLGASVQALPEPLKRLYGGQPLWKWIALISVILAGIAAAAALFLGSRAWIARRSPPRDGWSALLPPIAAAAIAIMVGAVIDQWLNITGPARALAAPMLAAVVFIMAAWASYLFCCAAAETLARTVIGKDDLTDATMLRIGARLFGIVVVTVIAVAGMRYLGADLIPLLAGLGVGGLAVALAAQRTFANLIGSLILFANKPVRVGDFCRFGDQIGTVESIGLLSTRIRSLERTVITVPNAQLSEMQLDNYSVRDERLLATTLQLRYETTPEQLRYLLASLRELLLGHPMVTPEPARVRFAGFGACSKDVEVFAYLRCSDHDVFCAIREDLLLRMDQLVADAGTGFAFPSQTAYLARDTGLDGEKAALAEERVGEWRSKGKLPFPEFEEEERERLEDTLDYPPRGSPEYRSRF